MKRISPYSNYFNENVTPEIDNILDKIGAEGIQAISDEDISTLDNYGKSDTEMYSDRSIVTRDIQNMVKSTPDKFIDFNRFGDDFIIDKDIDKMSKISAIELSGITVVTYLMEEGDDDYNTFDSEHDLTFEEFDIDTLVDIKIFLNNNLQ